MERLLKDLRHGLRRMLREPGFSLPVIATLGLGIGATVAIFTLVNAILLQPLPYPASDRLVALQHAAPGFGMAEGGLSAATFLAMSLLLLLLALLASYLPPRRATKVDPMIALRAE